MPTYDTHMLVVHVAVGGVAAVCAGVGGDGDGVFFLVLVDGWVVVVVVVGIVIF